jgi:hypothetical protein
MEKGKRRNCTIIFESAIICSDTFQKKMTEIQFLDDMVLHRMWVPLNLRLWKKNEHEVRKSRALILVPMDYGYVHKTYYVLLPPTLSIVNV